MHPLAKKCATYVAAWNDEMIAELNKDKEPDEFVSPAFQVSLQYFTHDRWSVVINFGTVYDRLSCRDLNHQNCFEEIDKLVSSFLDNMAKTLQVTGYAVHKITEEEATF